MARGQHKVFLGMAVGVGKTCRMLQEGHSEVSEGHDVAIGLLETHGRSETAALADGLELIPRRRVPWHGTSIEELDLPAILRRSPSICLIDELAHTNAPGLEHEKRYEDVEDVLAAGITVFSTVNVQHLQSVSARVAETDGNRHPRNAARPGDRRGRRGGRRRPDARSPAGAHRGGQGVPRRQRADRPRGVLHQGHLGVLREMALLQVVEEVEAHRLTAEMLNDDDRLISNVRPEHSHRFLGLIKPDPSANRIIRRAWGMAERLGGELDLLWVPPASRRRPPKPTGVSTSCVASPPSSVPI